MKGTKIQNIFIIFYITIHMRIEKKTWPEQFQALLEGKKKFDLRLDDFNAKPGDVLVFKEFSPETKSYTGRTLEKKISYVFKTKNAKFWSKEEVDKFGFQVFSLD
jgi:ribosomal protein S17